MKYIKTYEVKEYKIGDYVEVLSIEYQGEIIDKYKNGNFCVMTTFGEMWIKPKNIKRRLTSEEIKDYKIKMTQKNYNL